MGRQREFDLGRALAIATDLFWQQGYENTSVGQLTAAMGITPPSFYLAFKSKEALFRSAVATHQERQGKIIGAAFDEPDSRSLVRTLLSGFADDLTMPGRAQGCLILNNALPAAPDQSFRTEWADWRKRFRLRLQRRFKHDQAKGNLPPNVRPAALAQLISAVLWGLAVEAASGVSRKELHAAIDAFMATWPG